MGRGAIAVLCPQKTLELGAERNRASFADYLERELAALGRTFPSGGRHERLCGGGIAVELGGPSLAVEGRDYVAAFSGCDSPCSSGGAACHAWRRLQALSHQWPRTL